MKKHLYYYPNHATFKSSTDLKNIHNVVYCDNEAHVHYDYYDYSQDYFTTVARESGTISFNIWYSMGTDMITSISYSTDNGETWNTTDNTNDKEDNLVIDVVVNNGDKVLWKGDAAQLGYFDEDEGGAVGSFFSSDCEFDAQGNVMSLLYGDDFKGKTTIENGCAFAFLFNDFDGAKTCKVVNAKNLSLPAITLAEHCYDNMFRGCTSLTTAPQLHAETLASSCYQGMFLNCTSLTTAPQLHAETLANYCYYSMFYGCTNLTIAPVLPATTLTIYCYADMFQGCTSLTTAPELPATTLADYCYNDMFHGCASLNSITCLATDISADYCTYGWVEGVSATGTFIKHPSMNNWITGTSGIPSGWTVETVSN